MSVGQGERVQQIQQKVRAERELVSNLQTTVGDSLLKQHLGRALSMLDDVDQFFLNAEILEQPHTPNALRQWLDTAKGVVQGASDTRKYVEDVVEKFGPGVRSIILR